MGCFDDDDLVSQVRELVEENEQLRTQISRLRDEVSLSQEVDSLQDRVRRLVSENAALKGHINQIRKEFPVRDELEEINDWLRKDLAAAGAEIAELKSQIRRLEYGNKERAISDRDTEREGRSDSPTIRGGILRWAGQVLLGRGRPAA